MPAVPDLLMPRTLLRLIVISTIWQMHHCVQESTCDAAKLALFPSGWPKTLDAHVYWFSAKDEVERATGEHSRFYDPKKPTFIFIQGWNGAVGGGVKDCRRWTTACTSVVCRDMRILSTPWVDRGWNFGIFYWDQFADEGCVRDAETKIWLRNDDNVITWKSYDAANDVEQVRSMDNVPSVAHLCADALRYALHSYEGPSVRLVGHSLGGQMAAHCAKLLHEQTPYHPARPSRVALLDPFFSERHFMVFRCSSLKFNAGKGRLFPQLVAEAVKELWQRGVVTEVYKGSPLTLDPLYGDPAPELETLATYVHQTPLFCEGREFACGHLALLPLYTQRYADAQPRVENGVSVGKCTMPGPACSDEEIREFVMTQNAQVASTGRRLVWLQIDGGTTVETSDDRYRLQVDLVPTNESLLGLDVQPMHASLPTTGFREVIVNDLPEKPSLFQEYFATGVFAVTFVLIMCCAGALFLIPHFRSRPSPFLPLTLGEVDEISESGGVEMG